MGISNIKQAIISDLASIKVANGYNNNVASIYHTIKSPSDIDTTNLPAISCSLIETTQSQYSEQTNSFILLYGLVLYVDYFKDIDDVGEPENKIVTLYEDIVNLFQSQTSKTYLLDEVRSVEVLHFYPNITDTYAIAFITLKIEHNL